MWIRLYLLQSPSQSQTLYVWTSLYMLNTVRIYPNIVVLMADSKRLQLCDIKENKQRKKSCDDWIGKCIHKRTASSCLQWMSKPWQKHWFDCGWYQDIDDRMLSYRWIQLRTQLQELYSVHCPSLVGGCFFFGRGSSVIVKGQWLMFF